MKLIKTIVISITILIVAFLSIGFLVAETVYTNKVTIHKPIETVFSEFNKKSNLKKWIPEFTSIITIKETPEKKGSRYKIIVDNNGQEVSMEEKVIDFIPNEKVTLFYNTGEGSMLKRDSYTFKKVDDGTVVTQQVSCRSSGYLMACMFPIFKSKFKNQDQGYLNNLKVFLEK